MTEPAMPGSQPFSRSTPRPRPGGRDDPMRPLDIRILISICTTVPVLILIISVLSTAVCCWFFHHKWRRRDLCGKGGVIILGDDLQRANQEGRLLVNVALVNQSETNYLECNQQMKPQTIELKENEQIESSISKDPPLPLTEDGYAVLEPGGHDSATCTVVNHPKEYILPGHGTIDNQDHDYEELYWEPANQEEELLSQLSKLGLPVIHADCIELKEHLGNGEFGTVQRGLWSIQQGEGVTALEVAVKSMGLGACKDKRVKFLQEAAIMGQFGHRNILQVFGIILNDSQTKIVVEIMPNGDLLHHLISLRTEEGKSECEELSALLLSYTRQVANGMGYLSLKKYIHRDLAARNVLVSNEGICKIADFGLSRNIKHEDYYISQGGKIPVKWTAPEALHYRKYSTASDVWSYGCLLYEIWSLGCKPFHDITNAQVMEKVASGYRLPPPPGCPRSIYQIMIECWNPKPTLRPEFCDILVTLQQPDFRILKWIKEDLECAKSEKAKILGSPIEEGFSLYVDLQQTYSAFDTSGQN